MSPVHKTRSHAAKKALRTAIKSNRTQEQKVVQKEMMKAIVNIAIQKIKEMEGQNSGKRLPSNYLIDLVNRFKPSYPTLTVKAVQNAIDYQKRKDRTTATSNLNNNKSIDIAGSNVIKNSVIGRPKGSTKEQDRLSAIQKSAAINEVTVKVNELKKNDKTISASTYSSIVTEVKQKRNLPEDFDVKKDTVMKRIARERTILEAHQQKGGHCSPLEEIEPSIVQLVLCMSKFRQALTSAQIKDLVNSAIHNTEYQQKLIDYKKMRNIEQEEEQLGKVSMKYVRGFMKRWKHVIGSSRPKRFELDRSQWATYSNFKEMYDALEDAMLECQIAKKLPQPTWMGKEGNIVQSEAEAFGLPCTIQITDPDLCIVGDEVGANTSQKGDGHVGGKKVVGERGCVSQQKVSKKEKKFTVIGLTALTGEPVMCIVIIQGKERKVEIELGIDYSAHWEGSPDDADFVAKNIGPGKRFPGGPTCHFRGKDIPCLVRMSESGGINGDILLDIFKTLDHYEVFDDARKAGKTPMVLIDGHDSRFTLPFVQYVNDIRTKYCVTIGVPYGTSYWQVGDSAEQNGCFKTATYRAKEQLLQHRERNPMGVIGILPSDIIIIVNDAWNKSFANVRTNRKAIAERGWYPYNRNILLHDDIRATMTEKEAKDELVGMQIAVSSPQSEQSLSSISTLTADSYDAYVSRSSVRKPAMLNLGTGMGLHVLKTIVAETDIAKARDVLKQEKKTGEDQKQLLKDVKKISAASIIKCGTYIIGKSVAEEIAERYEYKMKEEMERQLRRQKREQEQILKQEKAFADKEKKEKQSHEREMKKEIEKQAKLKRQRDLYMERYRKAKNIVEKKSRLTWTVGEYRTVLMALKKRSDGKLPSTINELSACYDRWKDRVMGSIVMEQTPVDQVKNQEGHNDVVANEDEIAQSQLSLVMKEDEITSHHQNDEVNEVGFVQQQEGELSGLKDYESGESQSVLVGDTQTTVRSQILL